MPGQLGRVVGAGLAAGAFFALFPLATAPRAHADFEDLIFQPLIDALAQAVNVVDPNLALSLDPSLDVSSMVAPALAAGAATPLADLTNATIPLTMTDTTEPVINLSVSGGPDIPVLVDTGSNGLVIPWYDVGLQNLGLPTNWGIGAYSGGLDYFYLTFNETVNFGSDSTTGTDIVTGTTPVDVEIFSWPTSFQTLFSHPNFESFLAPAEASGVLGIAPDAVGPGPSDVVSALPGALKDGVLINEPQGYLEFGPNTLTPWATVNGIANTDLKVSVGGGPADSVNAIIDSGGVYGTIPQSILTGGVVGQALAPGEQIAVYNSDNQFLYSYNTTPTNSPTVISSGPMNTGYEPFSQYPIYLGYGNTPTTTFDKLPNG